MKTNNKTIAFRHFQDLFYFLLPPQIRPAPHHGGGGEQSSRGLPGEAMPSEVKVKAEEPPRALRVVDRLTRNPENLANAVGRSWKDTSGCKRYFKTHPPPYPTRRGLVTPGEKTTKPL